MYPNPSRSLVNAMGSKSIPGSVASPPRGAQDRQVGRECPQGKRRGQVEGQEHGAAQRAKGYPDVQARRAHDVAGVEREASVVRTTAVRPPCGEDGTEFVLRTGFGNAVTSSLS